MYLLHTGAGNASNATAAEMQAIASSIIGGTLLTGGVGNVIGTLFGVLTLKTISNIVIASGLQGAVVAEHHHRARCCASSFCCKALFCPVEARGISGKSSPNGGLN